MSCQKNTDPSIEMMRSLFLIIAVFMLSGSLYAEVVLPAPPESLSLHGHIASATSETPPLFSGGYLIFPYRGTQKPYRFVGIAFDYEGYSRIHAFVKNKKGTFVFYGKIPEGIKEFHYRLVVDSVWQHDTSNPDVEYDYMGVRLSKFTLDSSGSGLNAEKLGPLMRENGSVDFYLRGQSGVYAFIMGSFNQWDPFMTPMKEVSPGLYKVTLMLGPGIHYYNFLFNGQRMRDPNNFFQATGPGGELVSVFNINATDTKEISPQNAKSSKKTKRISR